MLPKSSLHTSLNMPFCINPSLDFEKITHVTQLSLNLSINEKLLEPFFMT